MPNESAKKPPQSETRPKENLNRLEWKAPTLAELLQRLSASPGNPYIKH